MPQLQSPDESLAGSGPGGTAELHEQVEDAKHKDWMRRAIDKLLSGFLYLNFGVFFLVGMVWWSEVLFPDAPKIVTTEVILALIAAFAAQFGVLAVSVGARLVPRSTRNR